MSEIRSSGFRICGLRSSFGFVLGSFCCSCVALLFFEKPTSWGVRGGIILLLRIHVGARLFLSSLFLQRVRPGVGKQMGWGTGECAARFSCAAGCAPAWGPGCRRVFCCGGMPELTHSLAGRRAGAPTAKSTQNKKNTWCDFLCCRYAGSSLTCCRPPGAKASKRRYAAPRRVFFIVLLGCLARFSAAAAQVHSLTRCPPSRSTQSKTALTT